MTGDGTLRDGLSRPEAYPHPVDAVRVRETHISWVFLTGQFAYKVKKPVKLDFLDFSTVEQRHHFCRQELRLNRRTAPDLYLDVVPIAGSAASPLVGGAGTAIDYALKMRQFPADAELTTQLTRGTVGAGDFRHFGTRMAAFHATADRGDSALRGSADEIQARIAANLEQTESLLQDREIKQLAPVAAWLRRRVQALAPTFGRRAAAGMVRECHGDLHLGNLVSLADGITAFDCIEFDPALRWIDVIDDVSFLVMDLLVRERSDLGFAFLDSYLADSGDYDGLSVMDLYCVHRSLVRAKVAALLRGERPDSGDAADDIDRHLRFADRRCSRGRPVLVMMHGLPASGKSSIALGLVEALPAIRVSSDIERKRLAGIGRHASSGSAPGGGLYDPEHNRATYDRLMECTQAVLEAGQHVIVDASFLNLGRRRMCYSLAARLDVPVALVDCTAPQPVLERRIDARAATPHDSEADRTVLRYALENSDALGADEPVQVLTVDTTSAPDRLRLADRLRGLLRSRRAGMRSEPDEPTAP